MLRHQGDAWLNPFVVVYESDAGEPSVKSVERLMVGKVLKGAKIIAQVGGGSITQYVLIQESMDDVYSEPQLGLGFKGQFAVLTVLGSDTLTSMCIGSGQELAYKGHRLETDAASHAAYRVVTGR